MLRKITDHTFENGMWRWNKNEEFYGAYEEISITLCIIVDRLKWLGHVLMMEDSRRAKKL